MSTPNSQDEMRTIPLHRFLPPLNDRENRDEPLMQRITASIEKDGYLQPVRCTVEMVNGEECYRVVTGWTRIMCGRRAGKTTAPAIVIRRPLTQTDDLIQKLTENDLRGATSLRDRSRWYYTLLELNPEWSHADLARAVHSNRAEICKVLRISNDLLPELLDQVGEGEGRLPVTAAYAIARLKDAEQQRELAALVLAGRLKRDSVEAEVSRRLGGKKRQQKPLKVKDDGASVVLPGSWSWEQIMGFARRLEDAAKRGAKIAGLTPSALPSLLHACNHAP